jgi:hypothetical protein
MPNHRMTVPACEEMQGRLAGALPFMRLKSLGGLSTALEDDFVTDNS